MRPLIYLIDAAVGVYIFTQYVMPMWLTYWPTEGLGI